MTMQQTYASLCLIGLSLTLLLSGTWCSPIHRRSSVEVEALQPPRCRETRPRSTYLCLEEHKVRRYFLHDVKGCKKFGICPDDAAVHDNKTEYGEGNFFQNFEDCQVECMQHITCPELTLNDHLVLVSDNGVEGWGKKVVYECMDGYSLSDNSAKSTRTCQKNGTWSGETPVCLKQCDAPPPAGHAYIAPAKALHSQGSSVHYTCQVGYELQGSAQRTCGPNGEWTNPEPSCVCQVASATDACPSCPEPKPIEHGQVSAPNRSLFAEVEYACDEGYVMIGNRNRICEETGKWSLEEPICWKLSIWKAGQNGALEDVTNESVTAVFSTEITFMIISSSPNPFPDVEPAWVFKEGLALPHGVNQNGMELAFDSILRSEEQKGKYTVTFGGNHSIFFDLITQEGTVMVTPPSAVFGPMSSTKSPGDTANFHCALAGCPVPDVVWYHNNQPVVPDERIVVEDVKSPQAGGLAIGHLTIKHLNEEDSGSYYCQGINSAGNDSTDSGYLQVSSLRKRSVEENLMEIFPCSSGPEDKNVTLVGHVRTEHRQLRRSSSSSSGMTEYRVQMSRFLQGTEELSSKRLRVVVLDSELSPSTDKTLQENVDYIFRGRIINQTLFVSRQNVQRHSEKLEELINSC